MTKHYILALFLSVSIHLQAYADDWFGQDKLLHFVGSAAMVSTIYSIEGDLTRDERLLVASLITLGAGAFKELVMDSDGAGEPSFKDMTWNIIGTVTGLLVTYVVDLMLHPPLPQASLKGEPRAEVSGRP